MELQKIVTASIWNNEVAVEQRPKWKSDLIIKITSTEQEYKDDLPMKDHRLT